MENENKENLESSDVETGENIEMVEDGENIELADEIESDEPLEEPAFVETTDKKAIVLDKATDLKTGKAEVASQSKKSNSATMILVGLLVLVLAGMSFGFYKYNSGLPTYQPVTSVDKATIETLLKDVDPGMIQQLNADPKAKKELADNLKTPFAIAAQAAKEGFADDVNTRRELANIEIETLALSYDRHINKDAGQGPPMGFITEDQINSFWNGTDGSQTFMDSIGLGNNSAGAREAEFEKFLGAKVDFLKTVSNAMPQDRQITDDERKQARDYFAKTRIYANEARQKTAELGDDFWTQTNFQIQNKQAQLLAGLYMQKVLKDKLEVKDEDVTAYLAAHPELDNSAAKKKQAEEILEKAKSGEDFAKLATQFSDDPGSKQNGGLYEKVTKGKMTPEFEAAALALEPEKIADKLVETPYGYHIIKLVKKENQKGADGKEQETYDVRHILIATGIKDPEDPMSQPLPPKDYAKAQLQKEKREQIFKEIEANNPVEVAEDFNVPEVDQEKLKKQMQERVMPPQPQDAPQPQPPTDKPDTKEGKK